MALFIRPAAEVVVRLPTVIAADPVIVQDLQQPNDGKSKDGGTSLTAGAADAGNTLVAALGAVVLFAVGLLASVKLFATPSGPTYTPADGIAAFAIFYVCTQAAERVAEVVLALLDGINMPVVGLGKVIAKNARTTAVKDAHNVNDKAEVAAKAQQTVDDIANRRTLLLFGFTALVGMILCGWLEADFLTAVGVHFADKGTVPSWQVQSVEMSVTGLIIGGGSKALHDLITNISKSNAAKDAPPGMTSGR